MTEDNYEVVEIETITLSGPIENDSLLECPHCGGVIQEVTKVCLNCEREIPLNPIEEIDLNWN